MRKLRLDPEDLEVQSFAPELVQPRGAGTVQGQIAVIPEPPDTEAATCFCDGSGPLDSCPVSCTCAESCYIHKCPTFHTGSAAPCC